MKTGYSPAFLFCTLITLQAVSSTALTENKEQAQL